MNGALGPWVVTLKTTVELLRSFQPEVWPVFVILVTCFILAGLYPFFAASNAMLVFTVGSLAWLVGSRIGQLAVWPVGMLVPLYTGTLFVLGVSSVLLARLEGAGRDAFLSVLGEEELNAQVETWRAMVTVLDSGEHCPYHFRGRKP